MNFDGITCRAIVLELNKKIVGGHLKKISQINPHTLILTVYAHRSNQLLYISSDPSKALIYLSKKSYKNPETPTNFCMFLRKHLGQAKISEISQLGLDRTIRITFDTHNEMGDPERKYLYCEFMGRYSNIILVDENNKILDAIKRVGAGMSRVRHIYPGKDYTIFPSDKKEILEEEVHITDLLEDLNPMAHVNKIFIRGITGFSPLATKEIAFRANVDPNMPISHLKAEEIEKMDEVLQLWIKKLRAREFEPSFYKPPKGAFYPFPLYHLGKADKKDPSMSYLIDLYTSIEGRDDKIGQKKNNLSQTLQKEIDKLEKKKLKREKDYQMTLDRDQLKKEADLLSAEVHRVKKGQREIEVADFYEGGKPVTIKLNPQKTPWENVESRYRRFSKLKKANKILARQIPQMENQLEYLRQISEMLSQADCLEDLEEIKDEMKAEGLIKKKKHSRNKKKKNPKALPPRKFQSPNGFIILVGRNNRQNDQLTLKEAGKDDIFFHAKTIPGSHVILFTDGKDPKKEDLEAAAFLAAKYSSQSQEASVDIDFTEKKHVYKAKGAKPGMVYYKNFQTISVNTMAKPEIKRLDEKN